MVEDYVNFLRRIKELKPYMVEFNEDGKMKSKMYLSNWIVNSEEHQLIIVIIYNREIQTTFVLRCGKVGMWEWNSRKGTRREHTFFCVIQNVDFSDQLLILQLANLHILLPST